MQTQTSRSQTPETTRMQALRPALAQVVYFKVLLLHSTMCDDLSLLDFAS